MAIVEVPSVGTRLAVYHGTSDETLAAGAGHLEFTSLPVGGTSSHCGISGHSGLRTARMFDDLRLLAVGDVFLVRTLGDTYAYRVYEIEDMVDPDEAQEHLAIEEGRDLCSFVTCTPYGVNSHRLIVHGERTRFEGAAEEVAWNATREYVNGLTAPLIVAIVVTMALWALMLIAMLRRRRKPTRTTPEE